MKIEIEHLLYNINTQFQLADRIFFFAQIFGSFKS